MAERDFCPADNWNRPAKSLLFYSAQLTSVPKPRNATSSKATKQKEPDLSSFLARYRVGRAYSRGSLAEVSGTSLAGMRRVGTGVPGHWRPPLAAPARHGCAGNQNGKYTNHKRPSACRNEAKKALHPVHPLRPVSTVALLAIQHRQAPPAASQNQQCRATQMPAP